MINEMNALVDVSPLENETQELANQILAEKDLDKTKDLIALFNWNMSKKNAARILKLNNLYDSVTDQMVTRFATKADQFSNSDLLDYMKTVQGAIDTTTKNLSQIEDPPVIIQSQHNTQINVNVNEAFDSEARARILSAVEAVLNCTSPTEEISKEETDS